MDTQSTSAASDSNASLNSLGYSPFPLKDYLEFIGKIAESQSRTSEKGFIVSVTGGPEEVSACYRLIAEAQARIQFPLAMEINLSCPNIPGKPPPAYSGQELARYIDALKKTIADVESLPRIPFGLKTPPTPHSTQFHELIDALLASVGSTGGGRIPCELYHGNEHTRLVRGSRSHRHGL